MGFHHHQYHDDHWHHEVGRTLNHSDRSCRSRCRFYKSIGYRGCHRNVITDRFRFEHYSRTFSKSSHRTTQLLGALISTVDLLDAETAKVKSPYDRDALLDQAIVLAKKLGPSYDSPTGMPWPKMDFASDRSCYDTTCRDYNSTLESLTVDLAQSGTNWLENTAMTRLSQDPTYHLNATRSWSATVWNRQQEKWPGLIK